MKIAPFMRSDLVKIAEAMTTTPEMDTFIGEIINRGMFANATADEIDEFDVLMEAAA